MAQYQTIRLSAQGQRFHTQFRIVETNLIHPIFTLFDIIYKDVLCYQCDPSYSEASWELKSQITLKCVSTLTVINIVSAKGLLTDIAKQSSSFVFV